MKIYETIAYRLTIPTSEMSVAVKGYYESEALAKAEAKGAGWYGSNGEVKEVTIYTGPDDKLYDLVPLGEFNDVKASKEARLRASIVEKLTEEERNFLKL